MANPRYSASRISTFKQCLLKYKLSYIDELVAVGGEAADVQAKGLDYHEIAEWMTSDKTYEDLVKYTKKKIKDSTYDPEKYPILKSLPRFYRFWQIEVTGRERMGFQTIKEGWQDFKVGTIPNFCGAIDLVVRNDDMTYIIDYKTGGTAKISDDYKRQLILYAIAISQKYNIPLDPEKIKLALFFPLAGVSDDETLGNQKVLDKAVQKNLKWLVYTQDDIDQVISESEDVKHTDDEQAWDMFDGTEGSMGFWCSWCQFQGTVKSQGPKNFVPCKCTYDAGIRSSRAIKIITKEELSALQK